MTKRPGVLCKAGWHRPLSGHSYAFIDKVSGKSVYNASCTCGRKWMTDSSFPMFGFKVERK